VTASPTAAWVWRQVINATPWGRHPTYLIHDRDAVYGKDFGTKLAQLGIASIPTPIRAPRANAVAERLVRTVRQECLDHVVVWNERHLHTVLGEFLRYYNPDRPHRALLMEMPIPRPPTPAGAVVSRPVLGGLHHSYARAA
jgi:transposase InsO family protein